MAITLGSDHVKDTLTYPLTHITRDWDGGHAIDFKIGCEDANNLKKLSAECHSLGSEWLSVTISWKMVLGLTFFNDAV